MQLPRTVKYRMRGKDVDAHGAALHRYTGSGQLRNYNKQRRATRETFGLGKRTLAKKAAKRARLPQYGIIGPALFTAMWRDGAYNAVTAYGIQASALLQQYVAEERDPRKAIVLAAKRRYEKRAQIRYSQARPMLYQSPPGVELYLDCSGFVTACYREAGCPDPNGYSPQYPGWGYTGTLWSTGTPISVAQLQPGDLVFYGIPWMSGGAAHVVIYRGGGRAYGHGQSAGPLEHGIFYRRIVGCRTYRLSE